MAFVKALQSNELPSPREAPGGFSMPVIRQVAIAGSEVLVTRLGSGQVAAFATHCPHQGTPLDRAVLIGDQLRCAQHNYVYDPTTGHNVRPSLNAKSEALFRLKPGYLPTFKVEEKDGWILVSDTPNPPPSGPPPNPMPPPSRHLLATPPAENLSRQDTLEPRKVAAGEAFEVSLSIQSRPGHIWKLQSESGIVRLSAQMFDEARGTYRLSLVAEKSGAEKLKLVFNKPWGGPPSNTVIVDLTVL